MARPRKEGMEYFPHDTDASSDEKIDAMRALFGNDGYSFYFMLCERIYRTSDAELDVSKPVLMAPIVKKLFVSQERFDEMLEASFELNLFSRADYEMRGVITSSGIKKRAEQVGQMREKWRKRKENHPDKEVFPVENQLDKNVKTGEETGERKEKESKEKKRELNNTTTTTTAMNPFRFYESERFGMLSSTIGDKIGEMIDDYTEIWVLKAMEEAVYYSQRHLPYVKRILESWKMTGHPEPWTLPRKEKLSQPMPQNVTHINRGRYGGRKKEAITIVAPTEPNRLSDEERAALRKKAEMLDASRNRDVL